MDSISQAIFPTPDFSPPDQFEGLAEFSWQTLVTAGINIILVIAVVVFFFIFVMGGIEWISSGGDKGKIDGARNKITSSLVGLVIVFAIFVIIFLINEIFGIDMGGLGTGPGG